MRRESSSERAAWTAHVDGTSAPKPNKYGAKRSGKYASTHEAKVAGDLAALATAGLINDIGEQVSYTLVPGNGKIRPIRYIADFVFEEDGKTVVADAKGYAKQQVYRLKKRAMLLIHGIEIREL
jgi:hypothetical protein